MELMASWKKCRIGQVLGTNEMDNGVLLSHEKEELMHFTAA